MHKNNKYLYILCIGVVDALMPKLPIREIKGTQRILPLTVIESIN
jgi:hypothetical protein